MSPRRGFILVAVMVLLGAALLATATLLSMVRSDAAATAGTLESEQARSLAWSGLQIAMSELDGQRDVILAGERPWLEEEYIVYESDREFGVVRLLPLGRDGDVLVPEAGKIDLNEADAAALTATAMIDPALAEAIITHRDSTLGRPYQSVAELLYVPGMTAEILYGPVEEIRVRSAADARFEGPGTPSAPGTLSAGPRGLADIVTVFAYEPALQQNGRLRINLNVEWSDELRDRVADRFGDEIANGLADIYESNYTFDSEAKLFQLLRFFQVEPADWVEYIDAFTAEPHDYHKGRLDLNTAPYEALLSLPGVSPEQANQMYESRDELAADERASVAWPAILEIVTPEQYDQLAGRITTRCWTWRVRLAAGVVDPEDPEGVLRHPVIYEAVIDLASPRPRIAYLRDVSLLETAAIISANAMFDVDESMLDEDIDPFTDDGESSGLADDQEAEEDSGLDFGFGDDREDRPEPQERDEDDEADEEDSAAPAGTPPPQRVGRWRSGG